MAEESNISTDFYIGEDKEFPFIIYQKDASGNLTTTPQNLTGWSLRWDMRKTDNAIDPVVLTKSTGGSGITIDVGSGGTGTITIADTDTDALPPRVYRHALKRTDNGSETVLLYGNAVLGKRTTR